jgi:hypothetical protein
MAIFDGRICEVDEGVIVDPKRELGVYSFTVLRHHGSVMVRRLHTSLQLKVVKDEADEIKSQEQ